MSGLHRGGDLQGERIEHDNLAIEQAARKNVRSDTVPCDEATLAIRAKLSHVEEVLRIRIKALDQYIFVRACDCQLALLVPVDAEYCCGRACHVDCTNDLTTTQVK